MTKKNTLTTLKQQEREARRQLIMDAAERVFSIRPFDKVSMREIADDAGIATSSIYTYFEDQESLFVEVCLREIGLMISEINTIAGESTIEERKLERIITAFVEYLVSHDSYFRMMVLFMTQGNLKTESMTKLNDIMKQAFTLFDGIFSALGYRGHVRKLSHFFFAALNGILVTYRKLPGRSEEEVVRHMKELGLIMKDMIVSMGSAEGHEKKAR